MRISDWSSDVCSSDLFTTSTVAKSIFSAAAAETAISRTGVTSPSHPFTVVTSAPRPTLCCQSMGNSSPLSGTHRHTSFRSIDSRSEEHTSELQVTNAHLVCRLLLDKKTLRNTTSTTQP